MKAKLVICQHYRESHQSVDSFLIPSFSSYPAEVLEQDAQLAA
jgi:hypothetical protein